MCDFFCFEMRFLLFGLVKLVLLELGPVEESDLDLGPGNNNMLGDPASGVGSATGGTE